MADLGSGDVREKLVGLFTDKTAAYPARELTGEDYEAYQTAISEFQADDGPLLNVRPPRENDHINAGIDLLETIHQPNAERVGVPSNLLTQLVGLDRLAGIQTNPETHAHEIWYEDSKVQFFYRPQSDISGDQFRRQIRNSYKNADVSESAKPFPDLYEGDYVAAATLDLKRPFYYPIKSELTTNHGGEEFERDPYADITSDMVVEEDTTSDGHRVTGDECTVMIQTLFEAARDVWSKQRPWGKDVDTVAHQVKEGRLKGNMVKGYRMQDSGSKDKTAAKIIEKQRGMKGYYATVRVVGFSPYKEIAERRVRTIATDMEKYYNSFTEQGLEPSRVPPKDIVDVLSSTVKREHSIGVTDRYSGDKFLQPVAALGGLAHLPNADINTPAVDWAKQESGAGVPADSTQFEEIKHGDEEDDSRRAWKTANEGGNRPEHMSGTTPPGTDSRDNNGEQENDVDGDGADGDGDEASDDQAFGGDNAIEENQGEGEVDDEDSVSEADDTSEDDDWMQPETPPKDSPRRGGR
ncbi:hypothetical protein [Halobacterium rubrum]|uniref:hypothetical protein n=1 Tax=Halobacterium TaxID=2239 RepID=UPI001F481DA9|nr:MULTISPECIES: hypothetical protein [Halobacterium]MDH5021715.1 hypothetical protein [Halobacterium rubrum]